MWTPIPPSTFAALAGATVLLNLSASNITIGKADYRRDSAPAQSARCIAAYLYTAAGPGESTTDLAWDGHALIYENGDLLAEAERFALDEQLIAADVDLERLSPDRMRAEQLRRLGRTITASGCGRSGASASTLERARPARCPLRRTSSASPTCPPTPRRATSAASRPTTSRSMAWMKRLRATGIKKVVIGVSGGLDSTHALIVCAQAMDRLGLPRANILGYTHAGLRHQRAHARATLDS